MLWENKIPDNDKNLEYMLVLLILIRYSNTCYKFKYTQNKPNI